MRVRINSYVAGSNGARHFKDGLVAAGVNAAILKKTNSRFRARSGDLIINYGDSRFNPNYPAGVNLLNPAAAIAVASNKREFFAHVTRHNDQQQAQVPLVPHTTSQADAQAWLDEGATVYARTVLSGHSGNGIVVVEPGGNLPRAQLYTKAITGARREYRVHVFNGQPILVQLKKRRNGFAELANASDTVRNLDGGWVFAVSDAHLSPAMHQAAVNAITSLGLDFGAVDIVAKGRKGQESEVYVLEVNTAPGQQGDTTTERYVNAVVAMSTGDIYAPYGEGEAPAIVDAVAPEPVAQAEAAPARRGRPRRQPVPDPQPTTITLGTSASQPNMNISLANGAFYFLEVGGEQTVGKYNLSSDEFNIIGEEVAVSHSDVTVLSRTQHIG